MSSVIPILRFEEAVLGLCCVVGLLLVVKERSIRCSFSRSLALSSWLEERALTGIEQDLKMLM